MAFLKRRRRNPHSSKNFRYRHDHRPHSPDDNYIKYAVEKPTQKELRWKNLMVTLLSMAYIFVGGGIFVWLEVRVILKR